MVALVLLPGLDGTGLLFEDFVASLGEDIDVIVASYPTDTALDYPELESIARRHLPPDKPFYLLGESFSGPIALSIAASPPPALLGVILCCSFARTPLPRLAPMRALMRRLPPITPPIFLLSFFLMGRFASKRLRAQLRNVLSRVAADVLVHRAHTALAVDVSTVLERIRVPLLYLRATEDRLVGRGAADQIVAHVPNARLVELAAPHFLLQVLPEVCAERVREFMS